MSSNSLSQFFNANVGRKVLMALTGLFLCAFLVEHLYGNLLLYKNDGGEAFNQYTEDMTSSILIRTVEIFLFLAILVHAVDALYITWLNKKARPVGYAVNKPSENSNWFSRNMGITGSVILVFLVIHLRTFFIEHRFLEAQETMSQSVEIAFQTGWYAALYFVAMIFLGFHLNHGFQSAFQTMGWQNKKYASLVRVAGTGFALLMTIGFASFPVIYYFNLLQR
jgi:succinate dehydrogenase / fumarate reductase, cytochrome b subunit